MGLRYFKALSNLERKQFVANVIQERGGRRDVLLDFSQESFVDKGFTWSDTRQGHTYWSQINNRVIQEFR